MVMVNVKDIGHVDSRSVALLGSHSNAASFTFNHHWWCHARFESRAVDFRSLVQTDLHPQAVLVLTLCLLLSTVTPNARKAFTLGVSQPLRTSCFELSATCEPRVNPVFNSLQSFPHPPSPTISHHNQPRIVNSRQYNPRLWASLIDNCSLWRPSRS